MASLVGMIDPPRDESKAAVAAAQAAHIRVRMVTGDDVTTGAAIAKQLGIPGEAMLGAEFAALTDDERLARIDDIGVVGRVAPEHKVLLANTLKAKGDVVAMTGDGVNDAPAIKAADIGIAMGSGTEVAKSAGRMVLSDDNFATIVYAVEQGRKIYDNLTKYIRFVLVLLVVFVLTFLGATLFNIAAGSAVHVGAGVVDPFHRERAIRLRPRFRSRDSGSHGRAAEAPRPVGAHPITGHERRSRGPGDDDRAALADPAGQLALQLARDRPVDRLRVVRVDARDRGVRVPQRDRLRVHHGDVRQQADELGRHRRGVRRRAHHADGRLQPHAAHRAARHEAIPLGSDPAGRAAGAVGARQAGCPQASWRAVGARPRLLRRRWHR